MENFKIAVIGAGASGLCAIKNAIDYGCDVMAFEQTALVGGLWNYTDEIDKDKYGLDIHSSMYQNLVTNLPIELMCYPNEPFREQEESFVPSEEVVNYYNEYARKYSLDKYIKFEHLVFRVRPLLNKKWEVVVKNLPKDTYETYFFDGVLVCSGHFHKPYIPEFKGQDLFKGKQLHSHFYRSSKIFKNEKTLVIGGNNSAVDLVIDSSKEIEMTLWSNHLNPLPDLAQFDGKVTAKPDVLEFTENGVKFVDGTISECSLVMYATGYLYSYPFLSVDCGILGGEYVHPLWMHCLSINNPTLGFIGLMNLICPNQMFQMQVEFCLTFMTGRKEFPTKEQMIKEMKEDLEERRNKNLPPRKYHFLGYKPSAHQDYHDELSRKAEIKNIMPYVLKMHKHAGQNRRKNFTSYRNVKYKILNENEFEVEELVKQNGH